MLEKLTGLGNRNQPADLPFLVDWSVDLLESGHSQEAREVCRKAIEIDLECAPIWSNLAFANIQLADLPAARDAAQKAIEIDPMYATAWHNLAEAHLRMGEAQKALTYNNRALTIDVSNPQYWLGKGTALMTLERCAEAIPCLDQALALDPSHRAAKLNRDIAWLRADPRRHELFLTMLGIAGELDKGNITASVMLAHLSALIHAEHTILDREILLAFDSFAEINIYAGKPLIVCFCLVNATAARLLSYPDLENRFIGRLHEAKAQFEIP